MSKDQRNNQLWCSDREVRTIGERRYNKSHKLMSYIPFCTMWVCVIAVLVLSWLEMDSVLITVIAWVEIVALVTWFIQHVWWIPRQGKKFLREVKSKM